MISTRTEMLSSEVGGDADPEGHRRAHWTADSRVEKRVLLPWVRRLEAKQ
jgi:hypothetical protein